MTVKLTPEIVDRILDVMRKEMLRKGSETTFTNELSLDGERCKTILTVTL